MKDVTREIATEGRIDRLPNDAKIEWRNEKEHEELVCEKSPDKKHHYKASNMQSLVYITNGSHTCRNCHYCGRQKCITVHYPEPNPLEYPTE